MKVKGDVLAGIGAIVVILLLVSFGAIGLLMRMSPAIEHVLDNNDESLVAVEQMLEVLALMQDTGATPEQQMQFEKARRTAQNNVTEPDEADALLVLDRHWTKALKGDRNERDQAVQALSRIGAINRKAMHEANEEAQRRGWAGAWGVAILGCLGFLVAVVLLRRIDTRILEPIEELAAVLKEAQYGDRFRRCRIGDASSGIATVMKAVNELLDKRLTQSALFRPSSRLAPVVRDSLTPNPINVKKKA